MNKFWKFNGFRRGGSSLATGVPGGIARGGDHDTDGGEDGFAFRGGDAAKIADEVLFPRGGVPAGFPPGRQGGSVRLFAKKQEMEETQRDGTGTDGGVVTDHLADGAGGHGELPRRLGLGPAGLAEEVAKFFFETGRLHWRWKYILRFPLTHVVATCKV
ncbi:MAG: hypothetical protein ACRD5L_10485, partial [Bryobacteraceae bacterium]